MRPVPGSIHARLPLDARWRKRMREGAREFIGFGDAYRELPHDFSGRVLPGLPEIWSLKNETLAPLFPQDRIRHSGRAADADGSLPRLALRRFYRSESL